MESNKCFFTLGFVVLLLFLTTAYIIEGFNILQWLITLFAISFSLWLIWSESYYLTLDDEVLIVNHVIPCLSKSFHYTDISKIIFIPANSQFSHSIKIYFFEKKRRKWYYIGYVAPKNVPEIIQKLQLKGIIIEDTTFTQMKYQ